MRSIGAALINITDWIGIAIIAIILGILFILSSIAVIISIPFLWIIKLFNK